MTDNSFDVRRQIDIILEHYPQFGSFGHDFPDDLRLEFLQELVRLKEQTVQKDQQRQVFLKLVELCGQQYHIPLAGFADRAMANQQVQRYFDDPQNGKSALYVLWTALETARENLKTAHENLKTARENLKTAHENLKTAHEKSKCT